MAISKGEETIKSKIYLELRRAITNGHLKPGERMDMGRLASHYETSITPLRDVFGKLSQEGLVTIKPRSGYFVSQITVKQLNDLLEMREILETASIERAINRITPYQIGQLKHDYSGSNDGSYELVIEENRRFHCLIAEASGNEELKLLLSRTHDQLARFLFLVFRNADKTQEQTHASIIEALKAGDAKAALKAILEEIRGTREGILARVLEEQGDAWQIRDLEKVGQ